MKTIAFDLDGTLVDVKLRDYTIYVDVLESIGYLPISLEQYWPLRRSKCNIQELLEISLVIDKKDIGYFLNERNERMEQYDYLLLDSLFDDVISVARNLSLKYNIVIVTKRVNKNNTVRQLAYLDILSLFSNIYITSGNKLDLYAEIENLEYIIGDTENDIEAANKLGIKSVAVETGIRNKELLEAMNPFLVVESLCKFNEIFL